ncbi:MAG TPA: hypothetical protein VIL99_11600 [Ignavibacteria bacterium]
MEQENKNLSGNFNEPADNKIYVGVVGAFIVVICFFLPWIEIDCVGKKNISGYDIGGILWVIPIGAAIFIYAFYSFYKRKDISKIVIVGFINFAVSAALLAYRYFSFVHNLKKELGSTPESLGLSVKYGAIMTILGEFAILAGSIFLREKIIPQASLFTRNLADMGAPPEHSEIIREEGLPDKGEHPDREPVDVNPQSFQSDKKYIENESVDSEENQISNFFNCKVCTNCNNENEIDAVFCKMCGNKFA